MRERHSQGSRADHHLCAHSPQPSSYVSRKKKQERLQKDQWSGERITEKGRRKDQGDAERNKEKKKRGPKKTKGEEREKQKRDAKGIKVMQKSRALTEKKKRADAKGIEKKEGPSQPLALNIENISRMCSHPSPLFFFCTAPHPLLARYG